MATYYKYAERDADSQINWAEVGKGLSDMLQETNRIREEKKTALDEAQRETMNYLAETPNGEHVGARQNILDFADQASNRMRIAKKLMEQGQMSVKDYTVFRQNLTDNTNLAFNANKAYQENYADVMSGVRDKKYSQLTSENYAEVEGFGNWKNIGFQISPNGIVMAGKMIEKDVDGKKVRALDNTPEGLRSMDYLNQAILSKIDFYDYEPKVKSWTESLGKEKQTIIELGKLQKQGKITSIEDITSRTNLVPGTKDVLYSFINAENAKIDEIVGDDLDASRILVDSAIIAPNNKPYRSTTSEKDAAENPEAILKVVDTDSGGFVFKPTETQKNDARDFIRNQMRSQYNYEEEGQVVGQVSRDDEPEWKAKKGEEEKTAANAANMLGKLWFGDNNQVGSAIDYFKGMKNSKGEIMFKDIQRDGKGINIVLRDGSTERISFTDANGKNRTQEDFIRSAGPLLAGQLDVNKALQKGSYQKGAKFNKYSTGRATTKEKYTIPNSVVSLPSQRAVQNIKTYLPQGFDAVDTGTLNPFSDRQANEVTVTAPNGKTYVVKTKISGSSKEGITAQANIVMGLEKFIEENSGEATQGEATTTTAQGGRTR